MKTKSEYLDMLITLKRAIRFGEYEAAEGYAKSIKVDLEDLEFVSIQKQEVATEWHWLLKYPTKLQQQDLSIRNDALIVIKFKALFLEVLCLFYKNQSDLGMTKFQSIQDEFNKIKTILLVEYRKELNIFIDEISDEIEETCLLSDYINSKPLDSTNEEISIEPYLALSQKELFQKIGEQITPKVRENSKLLNYQISLIKSSDVIILPPNSADNSIEIAEHIEFGEKLSKAINRRLYNILCDPNSKVVKELTNVGNLQKLIVPALLYLEVKGPLVYIPVATFIVQMGIAVFCDINKKR